MSPIIAALVLTALLASLTLIVSMLGARWPDVLQALFGQQLQADVSSASRRLVRA